jgi:hypothetical protein
MTVSLTRRWFINRLLQAGAVASWPTWNPAAFAQTAFTGKLLVTIQAQGAWDVTSFCDPKSNVAGEKEINRWARTKSIGTAGNLRYAPFGSNKAFFDKYYSRMLVINGVDMQTNAHETGETICWSGRSALGFPSLTALYAASVAPDLALAYVNLGGWGNTEGIINSTRIKNPALLRNTLYPNQDNFNSSMNFLSASEEQQIRQLYQKQLQAGTNEATRMPQDVLNRQQYLQALARSDGLQAFAALIPPADQLKPASAVGANMNSTIFQQVQMALLAFKSGLCVAADMVESGFDTHEKHDMDHEPSLANLLNAVDYLWDYAEQLGLADRLVVVIGSDFGRTPHYNAGEGKDHWPIGSYVVMEKNAKYTNRMIGETDGGHNALKLDPTSLQRSSGGTLIYSKHVHRALRRYLGLANNAYDKFFPFNSTEDFRFFG